MGTLQLAASMWFSRRSENSVTAPGLKGNEISKLSQTEWPEIARSNIPVLERHALHTGTNTNVNHTRLESVGNVHSSLQTTGALSVQTPDGGGLGETSNERSSTELSGTATGGKNRANSHILNQVRVDTAAVDHGLEDTGQQVSSRGVFETTLSTLGEGGAQSTCDDDIIGVLLGEGGGALFASTEVGRDLVQTVLG